MRITPVLGILFFTLQNAAALLPAKPQDRRDIEAKIREAHVAEEDIKQRTIDLRDVEGDAELERSIKLKIASLKEIRKDAYEQALWLTIRAYDILPFADDIHVPEEGTSVLPSLEQGRHITWLPIFDEIGQKPAQDASGRRVGARNITPEVVGNTASDGVSRIFPGAFESPAILASIIIHEKRHFTQNTTPQVGDAKTTAELEVEAYEEEERLLARNALGYTPEEIKDQKQRLDEALNGVGGKPGKRAKAKTEREEADKHRNGKPLTERSLVSHTEEDIERLTNQARKQIKIAQHEHDARLTANISDITSRSCARPGSVSQSELNELSQLHQKDFFISRPVPLVREGCREVYWYLCGGSRDAETVKRLATPAPAPGDALQRPPQFEQQPAPIRPTRPTVTAFSDILPAAKDLAMAACNSPGRIAIDPILTKPVTQIYFSQTLDDRTAANLAAGLGNCEGQVFQDLIETIRRGNGSGINPQWTENLASRYRYIPPPNYTPPSKRCEDYGNIRCP